MPIDLFRIDDRLLHGQVIVGWGMRLHLDDYLVVDDALAASDWEQELYLAGLPDGVRAAFASVEEAKARFADVNGRLGRGALLTRDTGTMRRLAEMGLLDGRRVNVGGIHARGGRRRILDYVHLSPQEEADLRRIARRAGRVTARDLPSSREVGLDELLTVGD
ncbi:MAG: PTS system mannose/fructose/N-acetylgalactosamine-transporter subunit IIB [Gemmatimonadota bacterium]